MLTLEYDSLNFRFPQIEPDARFTIEFQRTLRIPDTKKTYPLPAGLGRFPLRHVEDHAERLPAATGARGGVVLPMWQAEAMWISFGNEGPSWGLNFPVAIKVAAGKINAVSGEGWRNGLHRDPQDYVVSPRQPWLDGFAIEKGVVRQFVAMPLGDGYTAEEQITGSAEWGGLQISVTPLRRDVWMRIKEAHKERAVVALYRSDDAVFCQRSESAMMGMAPGGRMKQQIYPDTYKLSDWDESQAQRVFVSLAHGKDWASITGEKPTRHPPSAKDYADAGLPWFDYYGIDAAHAPAEVEALPGGKTLAGMTSLSTLFKEATGSELAWADDFETPKPVTLSPRFREVKSSGAL